MKLKTTLKKLALEYAAAHSIVEYGEIVETVWGDWKKPRKVKIYKIGAALSLSSPEPKFCMFYCAQRLSLNGKIKEQSGCGIVLNNFKKLGWSKMDGTVWRETDEAINSGVYAWELPRRSSGIKK